MRIITLYTFNELNPAAQEKAARDFSRRITINFEISKKLLSGTKNYNYEFLEDGTLVNIVEELLK